MDVSLMIKKSFTQAYQKHTDCGYGYKVVCCYDDKYTKPIQIYRGESWTISYSFWFKSETIRWIKNTGTEALDDDVFFLPINHTVINEITMTVYNISVL